MSSDQILAVGFGTLLFVVALGGLFFFKRMLRDQLIPPEKDAGRSEAMTELLILQAQFERLVAEGDEPDEAVARRREGGGEEAGP